MTLAQERAAARGTGDWDAADALKLQIEAAGWRIVDAGDDFELEPAWPADVIEDGHTFYGSFGSVPSRLDEPAGEWATVVVIVGHDQTATALAALAAHSPAGTEVVVVCERADAVAGPADEIVRTAGPFSPGEALMAALRRASGAVIVVLGPALEPVADLISPLTGALADPTVAIVGAGGLRSADLHHYRAGARGDVTVVRSGCYAFRRADAIARGPIDTHLQLPDGVAAWLSLALRDEDAGTPARRALALELPLVALREAPAPAAEDARRERRDRYRIAARFGGCDWLAAELPLGGRLIGDGAHGYDDHDDPDEGGHTTPA